MSPPRNPGAANFNRLMNLSHRLKKTVRNLTLHNLNSKNISNAYRASRRALNRAETRERKQAARRQLLRMQPNVNRMYATRQRLTAQRNTIRNEIAGILGEENEIRQNNTLAGIRRMQGTLLAQMIGKAYVRAGGIYSRKMAKLVNSSKNAKLAL